MLTTLLIPIPAIGGLALASVVGGAALREDLVFLAVLYASVYVRRFGQRWTALGIVATFAYFFGLFIGTQPAQLPSLAWAVLLGTASTFVVRFVVVPKHARGSLFWVMEAVRAQLRLVLERPPAVGASEDRFLRVMIEIARVNETMLAVAEQGVVAGVFDDLTFRCEVAAENVIVAAGSVDSDRSQLEAAEREMTAMLQEVRSVDTRAADPDSSSPQRDAILGEVQRPASGLAYRLRPTTRQAIQVTLAAAAAIAAGEHISPQRWYWAVITAFVVFSGTTSAGETLTRAWAGFLGTVVGVAAGTGVGLLTGHDPALESALLFVSLLFTAYFLRVGLGIAWFFVTLALVMLYELLGRFAESILIVRVLEVLTGVVCGGVAAFVVLPTSTRVVFRADVLAALHALRDGIQPIAIGTPVEAQAASRRFDAALRRLRSRVRPLRSGPTFAGGSLFARRWLRNLELCGYYARNAVCASREDAASEAIQRVRAALDGIAGALEGDEAWPRAASTAPETAPPQYVTGTTRQYVTRIADSLALLFTEHPRTASSAV